MPPKFQSTINLRIINVFRLSGAKGKKHSLLCFCKRFPSILMAQRYVGGHKGGWMCLSRRQAQQKAIGNRCSPCLSIFLLHWSGRIANYSLMPWLRGKGHWLCRQQCSPGLWIPGIVQCKRILLRVNVYLSILLLGRVKIKLAAWVYTPGLRHLLLFIQGLSVKQVARVKTFYPQRGGRIG